MTKGRKGNRGGPNFQLTWHPDGSLEMWMRPAAAGRPGDWRNVMARYDEHGRIVEIRHQDSSGQPDVRETRAADFPPPPPPPDDYC